jgi:hypothetical protein
VYTYIIFRKSAICHVSSSVLDTTTLTEFGAYTVHLNPPATSPCLDPALFLGTFSWGTLNIEILCASDAVLLRLVLLSFWTLSIGHGICFRPQLKSWIQPDRLRSVRKLFSVLVQCYGLALCKDTAHLMHLHIFTIIIINFMN